MGEIQIGEYVRTKKGHICKLIKINESIVIVGHGMQEIKLYAKFSNSHSIYADNYQELHEKINKDIVKHSKNIIDLIEVGDIIQFNDEKYEVIYDKSYNKLGILIPNKDYLAIRHISLEYIFQQNTEVKILTKEQYRKYCCKLEV